MKAIRPKTADRLVRFMQIVNARRFGYFEQEQPMNLWVLCKQCPEIFKAIGTTEPRSAADVTRLMTFWHIAKSNSWINPTSSAKHTNSKVVIFNELSVRRISASK